MDIGRIKLKAGQLVAAGVDPAITEALQPALSAISTISRDISASPGTVYFPASVTITKGQALNIFNGKFRLADRTLNQPAQAIALAGANAGQSCYAMLLTGYASGLTGLTANSTYYLSTAGAITTVKPSTGIIQPVGYALSATELLVNIAQF